MGIRLLFLGMYYTYVQKGILYSDLLELLVLIYTGIFLCFEEQKILFS
ncbi:hypothetical protein EHF_0116 [Ehrlichia japonica]|uniref:Uncharacterized protein n=1 Tax=Ehrlichia japonica TaxID=391036 RepID=X5GC05_9RICK|nr:hypothetical protein EHF_0116 [Ehrlichia japonica]